MTKKAIVKERPRFVESKTYRVKSGCGWLYVIIGNDDNTASEVFMKMGRQGSCFNAQVNALGRVISLALEGGVPAEKIVNTLKGIRCSSPSFDEGERVTSCADGVAIVLQRFVESKGVGNENSD